MVIWALPGRTRDLRGLRWPGTSAIECGSSVRDDVVDGPGIPARNHPSRNATDIVVGNACHQRSPATWQVQTAPGQPSSDLFRPDPSRQVSSASRHRTDVSDSSRSVPSTTARSRQIRWVETPGGHSSTRSTASTRSTWSSGTKPIPVTTTSVRVPAPTQLTLNVISRPGAIDRFRCTRVAENDLVVGHRVADHHRSGSAPGCVAQPPFRRPPSQDRHSAPDSRRPSSAGGQTTTSGRQQHSLFLGDLE